MAFSTSSIPDSLDLFRRCASHEETGCEWMIRSALPVNCFRHGGPPLPQYLAADDGGFLDYDFMPAPIEAWD